ncbi:MAG: hypothetical protein COA43_14145 [Robiginitomaculum sp.]|nr:MAG: hypothetical protein COA43_14145 [Robiginitomaculum sp.]
MSNRKNEKWNFIGWLGFRSKPDFPNGAWLGPIVGMLLFLLAIVLLFAAIMTLIDFILAVFRMGPYTNDDTGEAIRNIGLVLAALFGAPFLVWRTFVAAKLARISSESLFNDKIDSATHALTSQREITRIIEQDGNEVVLRQWEDDLVARMAAIDRFKDLVRENENFAPRIVRLLTIYIRVNFPCENFDLTEGLTIRRTPRIDLQKAVDTIGRIYKIAVQVDSSNWRLDLKGCNFDGVDFSRGYFRATNFSRCRFEASSFREGNFEGCLFYGSLLNYAGFFKTNLRGAKFDRIILNRPIPVLGGFVESINMGNITGASFIAADISALDYLGEADNISKTFGTKDTIISDSVREEMLSENDHRRAHSLRSRRKRTNMTEDQQQRVKNLEETGFQHWSPYDSTDGATGPLLENFYYEMKMKYWPFYG